LSLRSSLAKLSGPDKVAERTAARSALAPIVALAQRLAHNGARVQWETGAVAGILRIAQADAWDRGAASEAVGYWLDEARMWRDGRFDGSKWPRSSVWPDDRVRRLDVAAARLLAAGLERLDATWPPHTDVVRFMAKHARGTLEGGWSAGRLRALRHGFFDPADAELAACDALIAGLPRMQPPRSGLVARMQQWGEWATHDGDWSWTAVGAQVDQLRLRESSHLLGITEVRLLRLALAFRLGEPLPELVDPISGGPFDVRIEGNVASFRSTANGDEQVRWAERPR
ncbi:MAG: hypothetical protein JNK15_04155, partial [Planctomycetes bacterium]|nr:hypothetical protein [Planctomycetota bacterium]